jgi:putative MATE family efflux protein
MSEAIRLENKMGTMPIGRLLVSMSLPMMISMFIQALYNIVDSMFVAMIGENALTAVSLSFPLQNVIIAIGVGTGVGINALIPRCLGRGDQKSAERAANVGVFLNACYSVVFVIVGITFVRWYFTMQTDVKDIVDYGVTYSSIICIVSAGAFFGQYFEKLLVATGYSTLSMISQATGAVFNIIFDPLLIFGIGPFPEMGVAGAAVATVLGQVLAALVAFWFNARKNKSVRFHIRQMAPDKGVIRQIYAVGIPSMITVGLGTVMSFCLNQILLVYSTTATAVFGIWMRLQSFGYMALYGMNNGTVPILAYNRGADKPDRVKRTIRLAFSAAVILSLIMLAVFESIPVQLLYLFSASDKMLDIGVTALRICCLSFPFGGCCIILSSSFQALGRSRYTLAVNLCRQIFFMLPIAWLLSAITGNLTAVWVTIPAAECFSLLLALVLFRKMAKELQPVQG